ncbi:MAG: hypothetical protein QGI83_11355, partial [Candidatus Latescibacteria bacterium]|nr:hypothetical protein [Candidatus Latescibacterota bacterium]
MKFYGTTTLNGVTYTWPGADGGAGEVLSTNGGGTLSWAAGAADGDWSIDVPNSYVYNTTDRIGIGTASPATYLEIDFSDATTTYVGSSAQYGLIIANTDATANNWAQIAFSAQAGAQPAAWIGTHFTDHANLYGDLVFGTRGAGGVGQHMTIDQDGKVGIGTTSPDGPLHIYVA